MPSLTPQDLLWPSAALLGSQLCPSAGAQLGVSDGCPPDCLLSFSEPSIPPSLNTPPSLQQQRSWPLSLPCNLLAWTPPLWITHQRPPSLTTRMDSCGSLGSPFWRIWTFLDWCVSPSQQRHPFILGGRGVEDSRRTQVGHVFVWGASSSGLPPQDMRGSTCQHGVLDTVWIPELCFLDAKGAMVRFFPGPE